MSEFDEKAVGRGSRASGDAAAPDEAAPGRATRTAEAEHAEDGGSAFAGAQWESIGEADALADVKQELKQEAQAIAGGKGVHRCYAGCVHDQFDMMMTAHAEQKGFKKAPGAVEEAAKRAVKLAPGDVKQVNAGDVKQLDAGDLKQVKQVPPSDIKQGGDPSDIKQVKYVPPSDVKQASQPSDIKQVGDLGDIKQASSDSEAAYAGSVSAGKPAGFPNKLGLATWDYSKFGYPSLNIKTAQQTDKSWNAEIQTTTSKDAPTSAVATPVGTYNIGNEVIQDPNTNKNVNMKKILDVDATAAGQIKDAEQEHLDDVTLAYNITLKAAEDAVNANANSPFNAPKQNTAIKNAKDAVKNALDPKLTANPQTWSAMLQTAANLTRSNRDAKNWHTFNYTAQANDIDFTAKTVTYHVDNNPNVGVTPSSSIIKL